MKYTITTNINQESPMWQVFKDDIRQNKDGFKNRKEYEKWVRAWVNDGIYELEKIKRYYLGCYLNVDDPTKELNIKIGNNNDPNSKCLTNDKERRN